MPFRRLVVRPALAQIVERRYRLLRIAETELGARLAQRVDRVITHRQRQDVFVVPQRLFEFSQRQALLGERGAVRDGVGDLELIGELAITPARVKGADHSRRACWPWAPPNHSGRSSMST